MKRGFDLIFIGSGIVSTTFLILFQKIDLWDLPLWMIWNLVVVGILYQACLLLNKGVGSQQLNVYSTVQILAVITASYYTIIHHSPEFDFRSILYNYFIFFLSYSILVVVGFIIVILYGVVKKSEPKSQEVVRMNFLNETQLRAILNEALKNEDYKEAEKIQQILDKRFP